ncbi:MAG: hypothetical protein J6Q01_01820, partial [Alistipes sp.]|nr:hypothetical protein [Alistipes sp.]
ASMFSIPDKVTFAAGEKEAYLAIDVNSAKMEEDKTYSVSLLLADEKQGTPYGDSSFTVKFKLFPWEAVKTDEAEFGKFRGGDALTALYDVENALAEIDVKIYKHKSKEGIYMVQDPWAKMIVPVLGIESEDAIEDAGFKHTATNLIINCVDHTKCYIEKQNLGLTISQGELMVSSDYHPESNPSGIAGTLEEGVLSFPVGGILAGASKFESGTMFESNLNGAFRLVFPGQTAVDYTLAVNYLGMEVSPDMKDIVAKFNINYGSDVTGLKYYFAEGNVLANPKSAIEALINGTATDIREVENFNPGGKTMALNTTIKNGGLYTIVLAAVTAEGTLFEKTVAMDSFYYSGLGDTGSHPCEFDIVVGNYTDYNTAEEGQEIGDYNALGYNVKGKNLKELYVGCWVTTEYNKYLATAGNTVEKLIKESDLTSYTLAELTEVHSAAGKNGFLSGLTAETNYTVVVYAVNDYEESAVKSATFTTDKAPVYTGDFGVGKYLWKYENKTTVYESVIEVQSYQGSSTRFIVSNLGINDGSQWYATYDEEAGTLTLDGKVRGREKEGNLFGVVFGNLTEDTIYTFHSIAKTGTGGYKNDPFIFNVDKTTKKLVGHDNSVLTIYTMKEGEKSKTYAKFDTTENTTITPYVEGGNTEGGNTENK